MLLYDRNIIGASPEIFGNLRKSSEIFGKSPENVPKRSPYLRNNFGKSSEIFGKWSEIFGNSSKTSSLVYLCNNKQLLDEVFGISGIIKVEVSVISRSRRLRLITLTEILIIPDITKIESNNCFIIHCFEENNDKRIIAAITVYFQTLKNVQLSNKQIFTVFIKQSSAEKLNVFLKKVSLNLYLQVKISQFLAGSMKRIEKPFLLCCQ